MHNKSASDLQLAVALLSVNAAALCKNHCEIKSQAILN